MKKYLFILLSVLILLPQIAFGQDNCDISLGIYFDNDCPEMTLQNKNYLRNILNKALTEQSATALDNSQFGILVNTDINDKHIITGAPTKTVLNLYLTFSLTDIKTGKVFKSTSMDVNGVGNSEGKAFNNAIHKLKSQNKNIQDFSSNAKTMIIEYYNKNYNSIIKNAEAQSALRNYEEALYNLLCIPVCCTGYDQAMTIVRKIYKQYIDQQCHENLAQARAAWMSGHNKDNAAIAGIFLSEIYPDAACYDEAMSLANEINSHMGEEWKFEMKRWSDLISIETQQLNFAREIAMAYAQNQPQTIIRPIY